MPSSLHFHLTKMVDWIVRVKPETILDVGVGFGKWGFLAREYTDILAGRYQPAEWTVRIDGVEAFANYATPAQSYVYNKIYFEDVRTALPKLANYDLIIIGDVIEHFSKEEGKRLLGDLLKKSKFVLLSSPTRFFEQSVQDNPYEDHLSFWKIEDFKDYKFEYDEFGHWVFVCLIKGNIPSDGLVAIDSRPAQFIYGSGLFSRWPKLRELAVSCVRRLRRSS